MEKALNAFHYIDGNHKEHVSHLLCGPYRKCKFSWLQEGPRICPFQYVVVGIYLICFTPRSLFTISAHLITSILFIEFVTCSIMLR